jgi:cbb3-type cytochrome oxidase subunit 3
MSLDFDLMSSAVTVTWFIAFIALCLWAWSKRRHADFAAAERLPLEEDDVGTTNAPTESG